MTFLKKCTLIVLFLTFFVSHIASAYAGLLRENKCSPDLSEEDIRDVVDILAHPALGGRGTGQAGFDVAGLLLARELRNAEFLPLPGLDGYFQPFTFKIAYNLAENSPSDVPIATHSRNVIGYLPGTAPKEYIIIGAHYDHFGTFEDKVYLGADDNASGTTGVLEIARRLGECVRSPGKKFRRSIIIGFWGAEEWGLFGSRYFVKSGLVPLDQIITVLNLDMIGRNDPTKLAAIGAEHPKDFPRVNPILEKLLMEENAKLDDPFSLVYKGFFAGSDSYSFFSASPKEKRIPVLFLHSLDHDDYHKPSDTSDKINTKKLQNIAKLLYMITMRLATSSLSPAYLNQAP